MGIPSRGWAAGTNPAVQLTPSPPRLPSRSGGEWVERVGLVGRAVPDDATKSRAVPDDATKSRAQPDLHQPPMPFGWLPAEVEEEFAPPQLLEPAQPAAQLQVLGELLHPVDVVVEELIERRLVPLRVEPQPQVVLVGEVLARHVPRVAAERHLADGVHAQKRDLRAVRVAPHLL